MSWRDSLGRGTRGRLPHMGSQPPLTTLQLSWDEGRVGEGLGRGWAGQGGPERWPQLVLRGGAGFGSNGACTPRPAHRCVLSVFMVFPFTSSLFPAFLAVRPTPSCLAKGKPWYVGGSKVPGLGSNGRRLGQSRGRELAPLLPARMGLSPEGCRALCSDVSRHQRCCSDTAPSALRAEGWWSGGWKEPGRPSPVQASTEPSVACLARLHGPSPSGASPTWTLCTSWCASSHTGALFPLLQPEGHMSAVSLGPCPLETPGLQTRSELVPWGRRSHGSWCQDGRDRAQHKTP